MIIKSKAIIEKKNLIFFAIFFIFISSKVFSVESKIILKIDEKIITNTDVKNEMKYLKALNPSLSSLEEKKIFQIAKNSLIRENIKKIEISKLNEKNISKEYLENIIKTIYVNLGLNNKDEFINYINKFNISIIDIESKLNIEAQWNRLIYKKFFTKLKINKDRIKKEIETDKQFSYSYLLYEIIFSEEENEKALELHNKIKDSIKEIGFQNTASIFSISNSAKSGGKLGWIKQSSINKKILQQILNLKKNEYTDPILTPGGFLILKVEDIKKENIKIDIDKELNEKIKAIQTEQLNQYSITYFNKIKKEVFIDEI